MFAKIRAPCTPKWMCRIRITSCFPACTRKRPSRWNREHNALAVPLQAVNQGNGTDTVYVVTRANKIEVRPVSTRHSDRHRRGSTSGLKEGEMVVVSDRSGLKAGRGGAAQDDRRWFNTKARKTRSQQFRVSRVPLFHSQSVFHRRDLPGADGDRRHQPGADAGGSVSDHQSAGSGGGDFLFRHAAARISRPISPIRWSASSRWPAASTIWNRARCWASA